MDKSADVENTKVVIVGLNPPQERILTESVRTVRTDFVLIFIDKERRQFQLPSADLYVIWTKFISHRMSNAVLKAAKSSFYVHRGGLKEMAAFLQNWNCKK
jgi:hypothetical protein